MRKLKGFERTHLRGLAHKLKPVIQIGKNGLTEEVVQSICDALAARELIKVKFNEFKEEKKPISTEIEMKAKCEMVGMIGNVSIFFREQPDEAKRRIKLPVKGRKRERP
jgi:RNA-binding protein